MKRFAIIVIFILFISQIKGQQKYIDSLKHELTFAKEDSNKVRLYNALGYQYFFSQPDTSVLYGQKALELSKKIKFKRGEASSYFTLWVPMFTKGEYAKALDYGYKELHIYEELGDDISITNSHMGFANIYREQGDIRRSLQHTFIVKNSFEKLGMNDPTNLVDIHGNFAATYEHDNQLDSAIFHGQLTLDNARLANRQLDGWVTYIKEVMGHAYLKKKNYPEAMQYFKEVLPLFINIKNVKEIISTNYGIAASFVGMNNIDSALWYARKTYEEREHSGFIKNLQSVTSLLAAIYKKKGMIDSSAKYMELSMNLKDSLYSQAKEREIQDLAFEQQQREQQLLEAKADFKRQLLIYGIISGFIVALIFTGILWRNNKQKQKVNIELHHQKEKVENALSELRTTQAQLIQSEKMASLGELTAGIAHEIQNPLNFVNNFSEVNKDLLQEMKVEIQKGNLGMVDTLADDVISNEEKISHHGKRADSIVKGMLQHSRSGAGEKAPTELNSLADEYLRLAYQGLRAKDKSFHTNLKTDFDETIGKISIIPEDIGRVLLNLYNNAFYAVLEKQQEQQKEKEKKQKQKTEAGDSTFTNASSFAKATAEDSADKYEPEISVSTKRKGNQVEITVKDNGNGISQKNLNKIFQPFFTTKPTGQGTGLGLSLAYDIITKGHGGELIVQTIEGEGSVFVAYLPLSNLSA